MTYEIRYTPKANRIFETEIIVLVISTYGHYDDK